MNEPTQYLTFVLEKEVYAIGILSVKEIIEYGEPTAVPLMPPSIRGVINLRGAVVPVMDLRARFGGGASPIGKRSCIVIVEKPGAEDHPLIGVLVDAVNAVAEIPDSEIQPPPTFGTRVEAKLMRGMGKVNDRFVIILDPKEALSAEAATA